MNGQSTISGRVLLCALGLLAWEATRADAGDRPRRRGRLIETVARSSEPTAYPGLGTFYPTPMTTIRGNFPVGGGYTPLDSFGNSTMALYGPLSAFRNTAAPVQTYTRGYDGRPTLVQGTSFSTPNAPDLTPVVYPTQSSYYYAPRSLTSPPWWDSGFNWIDQN